MVTAGSDANTLSQCLAVATSDPEEVQGEKCAYKHDGIGRVSVIHAGGHGLWISGLKYRSPWALNQQ